MDDYFFCSVLADLGLPQDTLLTLVGFNLGVESGQLAIVSIFLPLAHYLRNTLFYRRAVLFAGLIASCCRPRCDWSSACSMPSCWDFKPLNFLKNAYHTEHYFSIPD